MRSAPKPPRIPLPTSQDEWTALICGPSLRAFFTPNAIATGTTERLLDAYAKFVLCPHRNAIPVEDITGERVAALCPDCDSQLPAEWAVADSFTT